MTCAQNMIHISLLFLRYIFILCFFPDRSIFPDANNPNSPSRNNPSCSSPLLLESISHNEELIQKLLYVVYHTLRLF